MSEVRAEVRRTRGDIFNGILANTLRSPGSLAWYVGGSAVVAAIAVIVNRDRPVEIMAIVGAIAFAAMIAFYSLMLLFCVVLAAHKTWPSVGALDPVRYTFSDEGLGVEATTGHGLTHWATWKTAFETKSLIVVRHQLNLIHILPKRGLSDEALIGVRSVLNSHLKDARLWSQAMKEAA